MRTESYKRTDIEESWIIIDATGITLGRFASKIADILSGKNKPEFTPNADLGDYVIVINAGEINVTGKKLDQKVYYRHSGYPGGIKSRTAKKILEGKFPDRVIRLAVKRMIPKGPLGRQQFSNMKVYYGSSHPHDAQAPEKLNISEII